MTGRTGTVIAVISALAIVGVLALYAALRSEPPAASPSTTPPSPTATVATASVTPTAASPAATATAVASPGAGQTYTSPLGYTIRLPTGWRRSDLVSQTGPVPNGDPEIVAIDVFTIRTPEDERDAMRRTHVGLGPIHFYTAWVRIDRNSRGLDPKAFAEREQGAYGLNAESVATLTFQGRPAARTTWVYTPGDLRSYATYFRDGSGRMWVVGFYLGRPGDEVPPGATEAAVRSIVESFRYSGT